MARGSPAPVRTPVSTGPVVVDRAAGERRVVALAGSPRRSPRARSSVRRERYVVGQPRDGLVRPGRRARRRATPWAASATPFVMTKTPPPRSPPTAGATSRRQPQHPIAIQNSGPRPFFAGGAPPDICGTGAVGRRDGRGRPARGGAPAGAGAGRAAPGIGRRGGRCRAAAAAESPASGVGVAMTVSVSSGRTGLATVASGSSSMSTRKASAPKRSSCPFLSAVSATFRLLT